MRQNGLLNFILLLCVVFGVVNLNFAHAQEASKPKPVKVATPQRGKIEQQITYTGNLEADAMVEVYADVSGKLVVLKVDEGDQVNKGDVLAQTDSRELRLALKQAQAALKATEAQLLTVKSTAQIRIEAQADAAHASLDAAKAQLEQAQALVRAQAISQFEQAKAVVAAAEANLKKAMEGARNQEIQQAKAAVSGRESGVGKCTGEL